MNTQMCETAAGGSAKLDSMAGHRAEGQIPPRDLESTIFEFNTVKICKLYSVVCTYNNLTPVIYFLYKSLYFKHHTHPFYQLK